MSTRLNELAGARLEPAEKMLKAALHSWNHPSPAVRTRAPRVFVTVSRQPGAGAISFSHKLAERLNRDGAGDWSAWDKELVEKVSADHRIAKEIIEMIPNRRHNWLDELLHSLLISENPPDVAEVQAYKRVTMTISALAAAGHAIIVGQGGTFITQAIPGAIHLRLIAPLEHRIQYTAQRDGLSMRAAAARVERIDRLREDFYRRYWTGKSVGPESFTMTLNCAEMSVDELVECIAPLVRMREAALAAPRTNE